jgi:hypothetical protein
MTRKEDSTPKTEQELLARIYESGQARKRLRSAGAPDVGIFWVIGEEPLIDKTPLNEAGERVDFFEPKSHSQTWPSLQRIGIVPRNSEFDDYPHGRVVLDKETGSFRLFADKCILKDEPMVQKILSDFHLPSQTKTEADPHYKCPMSGVNYYFPSGVLIVADQSCLISTRKQSERIRHDKKRVAES